MFEKASRMKLRFNHKGTCSVEDLWTLSLTALDTVFKDLNAEQKAQEGESLLRAKTKANEVLGLKISIVKHIFETLMAERNERQDQMAKAEQKHKILKIIADKQDAELMNMPIEELRKVAEDL